MERRPDPRLEVQRLRWEQAYLDLKLKLLRLHLALRYDASQPRTPAGTPDGGQWVAADGSAAAPTASETIARAPQTTVQADGTRQELRQTPSSDSSWLAVRDTYRADGSLANQTVFNRDFSIIDSQFAPADGSVPWDSRHTIYAPDGRILTVQNAGPVQTLFDAQGQAISQSVWHPDGPEPQPLVQPAFVPALVLAPAAAEATIELGLILFTWLAARQVLGEQPVMVFRAREYERTDPDQLETSYVGTLPRERVETACPRMGEVQTYTDDAVTEATKDGKSYASPALYGTAVHSQLNQIIKALGDPDLKSERSFLKTLEEARDPYGVKGSIRIDVLEAAKNNTVCAYDIKTGVSSLGPTRMAEIARNAVKFRDGTTRVIVSEIRPSK